MKIENTALNIIRLKNSEKCQYRTAIRQTWDDPAQIISSAVKRACCYFTLPQDVRNK